MSISLIVTKSYDRQFEETGEKIAMEAWLELIERDPELRLRTEDYEAQNPMTGAVIRIGCGDADSEILVDGDHLPFLCYGSGGELTMKYTDELDDVQNPRRNKVADVAKVFGAIITHDAGDEILEW